MSRFKRKTCDFCKGKGFKLKQVQLGSSFFGGRTKGVRIPCMKCHGKGVR